MSGSSLSSEPPHQGIIDESDDEELAESLDGAAMDEVLRVVTPLGSEFFVSGHRLSSSSDLEYRLWMPLELLPGAFTSRHRFAFSSAHHVRSQETYESLLPSATRALSLFAQVRLVFHADSGSIVVQGPPRVCRRPAECATVREYDTEARKGLNGTNTLEAMEVLKHHLMTSTGVQQRIRHKFLAQRQVIDDSSLSEFRLQALADLVKEQLARSQLFHLLGFVIIQSDFELTVDDNSTLLTLLQCAGAAHLWGKVPPLILWRFFTGPRLRRSRHTVCYIHSACDAFRFLAEQLKVEMRGLHFVTVSDVNQIPAGGQSIIAADEQRSTDSLLFYLLHWLPSCSGSVDYFVTQVAVLRHLWSLSLSPRASLPDVLSQSTRSNYRRRILCESLALSSGSCAVAASERGLIVLRFEENPAVMEGQTYPVLLKADAHGPFSQGVVLDKAMRSVEDEEWIELIELDNLPALKRALRVAPTETTTETCGWRRSTGVLCEERQRRLAPAAGSPHQSQTLSLPPIATSSCAPASAMSDPKSPKSEESMVPGRLDGPLFRCRVQRFADRRRGKGEYAEVLLAPLEGKKNAMMPPEDVVVINACIAQCLEEANLSSSDDEVNRTVTILLRKTREAPPHILMPAQAATCFLKHLSDSWRNTTECVEGDTTISDVWKKMARIAQRNQQCAEDKID